MNEPLRLLPGEDPDDLIAKARAEHKPIATFCLFSGGGDSAVLAHRCRDDYLAPRRANDPTRIGRREAFDTTQTQDQSQFSQS